MKRAIQSLAMLISTGIPFLSYAHEGHGVYHADDVRHYLLSSAHAIPIGAMVITLVFILVKMTQQIRKTVKIK